MEVRITRKSKIDRKDFGEYINKIYYNISGNKLTLQCDCKKSIKFKDNIKHFNAFPNLKEEIMQIYEESIIPFIALRTLAYDHVSIEEAPVASCSINNNINYGIQVIGNDCLVFASYGNCGEKLISMLNALEPLTDEDRDSLITEIIEKANKIKK